MTLTQPELYDKLLQLKDKVEDPDQSIQREGVSGLLRIGLSYPAQSKERKTVATVLLMALKPEKDESFSSEIEEAIRKLGYLATVRRHTTESGTTTTYELNGPIPSAVPSKARRAPPKPKGPEVEEAPDQKSQLEFSERFNQAMGRTPTKEQAISSAVAEALERKHLNPVLQPSAIHPPEEQPKTSGSRVVCEPLPPECAPKKRKAPLNP